MYGNQDKITRSQKWVGLTSFSRLSNYHTLLLSENPKIMQHATSPTLIKQIVQIIKFNIKAQLQNFVVVDLWLISPSLCVHDRIKKSLRHTGIVIVLFHTTNINIFFVQNIFCAISFKCRHLHATRVPRFSWLIEFQQF